MSNSIVNPTEKLNTVSPLYSWANEVRELFKLDPDIKLTFDDKTHDLHIIVKNPVKALCIRRLLPEVKNFVDGHIQIFVDEANRFGGDKYLPGVLYEAFKGNPLFDYIYEWADPNATSNPLCWVCMNDQPVIYPESNLHHIYGDTVKLPENIATDVLTDSTDHIFYCTDNKKREAPDHSTKFFNE